MSLLGLGEIFSRGLQPTPENTRGLLEVGTPHDPVRRRDEGELLCVPGRVACTAYQSGRSVAELLELTGGAREAAGHGVGCGFDDDLDVVFPSAGEVPFEHGDRVDLGWRAEGVVEHVKLLDPVDP